MANDTMQAAVLHGAHDLRLETVPRPTPGENQALVQILANGLCGSDIHFFEDGRLGPFVVDQPYIPGHEAVGTVVEINPEATGSSDDELTVGDRVVIEPGIPCRQCEHCKSGRYNLCPDVTFLSAPPVNGTFAEYVALPTDFLFRVPDTLTNEVAALVEPLSVGIHACNRAAIGPNHSVAVLGAGPIGLITFLAARAFGAGPVAVIDVESKRLDLARSLGADTCIDGSKDDLVAVINTATGGRGVDIVFDCTGSSQACASAPTLAARGGVVVIVGWPESSYVSYPIEMVLEKELDVRGVNRYCNIYPTAIRLLAEGRIDLGPLVSHRFEFDSVVAAFRFASENRAEVTKVVVVNGTFGPRAIGTR